MGTAPRRAAEIEARDLVMWRNGLLAVLRDARNNHLGAYHRAKNHLVRHGVGGLIADFALDVAEVCETQYQELDRRIDLIERAPWEFLLEFYRSSRRTEAAA